jgi:hypothetical protein
MGCKQSIPSNRRSSPTLTRRSRPTHIGGMRFSHKTRHDRLDFSQIGNHQHAQNFQSSPNMGCKQSTPANRRSSPTLTRRSRPTHIGGMRFSHKTRHDRLDFSQIGNHDHAQNFQCSPNQSCWTEQAPLVDRQSSPIHNGWVSCSQQMAITCMEEASAPSTYCDSSPSCSAPSCCDM